MKRFQSSQNNKVYQIIFVSKANSFTLFLITIILCETAEITQNATKTIEAIVRTIPLEVINFKIFRFKQALHLANVYEDTKMDRKSLYVKSRNAIFTWQ